VNFALASAAGGAACGLAEGGPENFHRYLLLNGAQHVSRAGDVREVDLGFDFFFAVGGTRSSPCGTWHRVGAAAEVLSHQVRFVIFQGTGVRFFSVTPTVVRVSRISLLLTSNSRARSLIRILLIRSRFLLSC